MTDNDIDEALKDDFEKLQNAKREYEESDKKLDKYMGGQLIEGKNIIPTWLEDEVKDNKDADEKEIKYLEMKIIYFGKYYKYKGWTEKQISNYIDVLKAKIAAIKENIFK